MKKTRVLILAMSVSAVTPALLGSAWGVENRGRTGHKQECENRGPKPLEIKLKSTKAAAPVAKPAGKKNAF